MKFNFSTEQEEFRSNLRRLLADSEIMPSHANCGKGGQKLSMRLHE